MDLSPARVCLLRLPLEGRRVHLRLHLEDTSRHGSVKGRTAFALLDALPARPAGHPRHIVESTSGNLGIALAGLCAERGYRCTLVVDDATSPVSLRRMTELGAELIQVTAADRNNAVAARIEAVHAFLAEHPEADWTDQYHNPAGPAMHAATTGPALLTRPGPEPPQAVLVPVSTGGTLAGVARHLRARAPRVRIWAVDATGSVAVGGAAGPRRHKLPGFGSGLRSHFLEPGHLDAVAHVDDLTAAETCRRVLRHTGVWLGGSAGATVFAAVRASLLDPRLTDVACLCPDGGERYASLIYATGPPVAPPRSPAERATLAALARLRVDDESEGRVGAAAAPAGHDTEATPPVPRAR